MIIRESRPQDNEFLHVINEAGVPGVGTLSRDRLAALEGMAAATLVAADDAGRPIGFVLVMFEGLEYDSLNYRWLSERYDRFAYVDRIAVAGEARGQGVGEALYGAVVERYSGVRPVLLAEVNLAPPNSGSLKFHQRLGFRPVGERWEADREKGVVYLEKALVPGP